MQLHEFFLLIDESNYTVRCSEQENLKHLRQKISESKLINFTKFVFELLLRKKGKS